MENTKQALGGVLGLPNEILLRIFDLLDTKELLPLTPVCRPFHSLVLRVLHTRLQIASGLDGHTLFLECGPPSTKLSKMFCNSLGTEGLDDLLNGLYDCDKYAGQIKQAFTLYSRFRPQHREPGTGRTFWNIPGDIPGSRTHPSSNPEPAAPGPDDAVSQIVTVDAHDLFSQLSTFTHLVRRGVQGYLMSVHDLSEGHIRVWRDWLAKQCESKRWTDGESIAIQHDVPTSPTATGKGRADSVTAHQLDPRQDPNVLWVSTRDENVGIKFRVKERVMRRAPTMYSSEVEIPVSYRVEFEEIVVRTAHLLQKIEEADKQLLNGTGKSVVFGTFRT